MPSRRLWSRRAKNGVDKSSFYPMLFLSLSLALCLDNALACCLKIRTAHGSTILHMQWLQIYKDLLLCHYGVSRRRFQFIILLPSPLLSFASSYKEIVSHVERTHEDSPRFPIRGDAAALFLFSRFRSIDGQQIIVVARCMRPARPPPWGHGPN